jgi:hypothetical protein
MPHNLTPPDNGIMGRVAAFNDGWTRTSISAARHFHILKRHPFRFGILDSLNFPSSRLRPMLFVFYRRESVTNSERVFASTLGGVARARAGCGVLSLHSALRDGLNTQVVFQETYRKQ